tara:strand:- start:149 stop:346 length:198 start_codon:yes stop_codon:yes gene_type:complete
MKQRVNKKPELWVKGQDVKIGFLTLGFTGEIIDNKQWGQPKGFILESIKGIRYEFIPHHGLTRID